MKIYTRTGDAGETSLFGGRRVSKDALRIESYGTIDELNSVLGIIRADNVNAEIDRILDFVQNQLFTLGADLATPVEASQGDIKRIGRGDVDALETFIDGLEPSLPPLRSFILPGGLPVAARIHLARTVCRRAERLVVRLGREEKIGDFIIVFLNRLSDLLFVVARYANHVANVTEIKWKP